MYPYKTDCFLGFADAARNGERVAVFSHQPVLAPEKPQSVIWNSESLMDVMAKHGNVRLWMAGMF